LSVGQLQKRAAEVEETLSLKRMAVEEAETRLQTAAQQADAYTHSMEQASVEERRLRASRRRTEAERVKLHAVDEVMQQVAQATATAAAAQGDGSGASSLLPGTSVVWSALQVRATVLHAVASRDEAVVFGGRVGEQEADADEVPLPSPLLPVGAQASLAHAAAMHWLAERQVAAVRPQPQP